MREAEAKHVASAGGAAVLVPAPQGYPGPFHLVGKGALPSGWDGGRSVEHRTAFTDTPFLHDVCSLHTEDQTKTT